MGDSGPDDRSRYRWKGRAAEDAITDRKETQKRCVSTGWWVSRRISVVKGSAC